MQDSGRQHLQRGIITLLLTLIISSLAVWANSEVQSSAPAPVRDMTQTGMYAIFTSNTRVMLFSSSTGQWVLSTFAQAKPGNELYFNNRLHRVVDSSKAQVVSNIDAGKLLEADLPYDNTNHRRPGTSDAVQVLDKDMAFVAHALLSTVQPGTIIRFQGSAYNVAADHSLTDTKKIFSAATNPLQRIEITRSAMQHIIDRHTIGGTKNAGTSIFNSGENIQALIKNAELVAPVLEDNGYLKRMFDAGRTIGYDGQKGTRTSTYRVITTQSGKLVTAFPVVVK